MNERAEDLLRSSPFAVVRLDADGGAEPHGSGGIQVWGTASLVGLLHYPEHGTVEFRGEDELFDPQSMESAIGIPLTLDHPPSSDNRGLVTPDTVRDYTHGWVTSVARRGDDLRVRVVLASRDALDRYHSGERELSLAYRNLPDETPGVWESPDGPRRYTGRQTKIRYNAIALVPRGRAGHTARLDSAPKDDVMKKLKIRNITRDCPDFLLAAIEAHVKAQQEAGVRADGMAVEEVTLRGATLTLPKTLVDEIEKMLTGSVSSAASSEPVVDNAPVADPTKIPPEATRMDAASVRRMVDGAVAAALAGTDIPKIVQAKVESEIAVRTDAANRVAHAQRTAAPLLGGGFDFAGKDEHAIAAAVLVRLDAAAKDEVEALEKAARGGDQRAAGRLEERMASAIRVRLDGASNSGAFALALDDASRSTVRADAATVKPTNIEAAMQKRRDRQSGKKTA